MIIINCIIITDDIIISYQLMGLKHIKRSTVWTKNLSSSFMFRFKGN